MRDGNVRKIVDWKQTLNRDEAVDTWKSWKEALAKHDEETLLAMIKGKTVEARRDPNIPESLGVPWPKYLHIKLIEEKSLKRKDEAHSVKEDRHVDDDEFEREGLVFVESGPVAKQARAEPSSSSSKPFGTSNIKVQQQLQQQQQPEAVQVAVKAVRALHSQCDKFMRELDSTVANSQANKNSSGCKVERDLASMITTLQERDAKLLQCERRCNCGETIAMKDVEAAGTLSSEVGATIKYGKKKVAAHKTLFRL